jgi:fatty-acid peroxygenase
MAAIPRAPGFDHTISLLRDPYRFLSRQCRAMSSDIFQTRILLQPTICLTGAEAAELFYGTQRMMRRGAAPMRVQKTLLGKGGIQGTDDDEHRSRKQMFLSLMAPERIRQLGALLLDEWGRRTRDWASRGQVVLYHEAREMLMRVVCDWAAVPLEQHDLPSRAREVSALFDHAGSMGPKHWWARLARRRCERWIAGIIADIRAGRLHPPAHTAAHVVAMHRDISGGLLPLPVAAVELLNVIRPTVAVAVYLVQVAHALHRQPGCASEIASGQDDYASLFVQEVRRWYPFFPAAIARVREDFAWKGFDFPRGRRVMLDLYGTNHDPRSWDAPDDFRPERFRRWDGNLYSFIPQGGGDHRFNHRCPGEWIASELMTVTARFLSQSTYSVPPQDLTLDYTRLPALPRRRV